jgi:ADP-ribose pyrophosphatase YjhB (NUDIX family)
METNKQSPSGPIDHGTWSNKISWELHETVNLPPLELCTAVFCLAITQDHKIVLARPSRGWGLLGGHIEEGETALDALMRESLEEGGFIPEHPQLFAHRKIISSEPIPHQDPAKFYPCPVSYNLFYWATSKKPLAEPTGIEILESGVFTPQEAIALSPSSRSVIELGYGVFTGQQA